jgi:SAM-dependent methyltransferase
MGRGADPLMHPSAHAFIREVLTAAEVEGRSVLEVGSYDVNGSVRLDVERLNPASYVGADIAAGPGVDRVVDCEDLPDEFGFGQLDVVISAEMLEHVRDWQACLLSMATVLRPGGLLVLTTRSPGMPFHPYPEDHWRFTPAAMWVILGILGLEPVRLEADPSPAHPGVFFAARKPAVWARAFVDWPDVIEGVERVETPAWWGTDLMVRATEQAFYATAAFEGQEGFIARGQIVQAGHPATHLLPHIFELAD